MIYKSVRWPGRHGSYLLELQVRGLLFKIRLKAKISFYFSILNILWVDLSRPSKSRFKYIVTHTERTWMSGRWSLRQYRLIGGRGPQTRTAYIWRTFPWKPRTFLEIKKRQNSEAKKCKIQKYSNDTIWRGIQSLTEWRNI